MAQLLQPGQRLAGYEIVELVGRGGMGEVYRARQLSMDRQVALKILAPRLATQDPSFAKAFVEEARAAGRLNHPNIIGVHDVGQAHPPEGSEAGAALVDYFSMEFIEGESVKDVLQREGRCPDKLIAMVMQGMSEALVYAEAQGIVHRDIKPDNIMITANHLVKLADLGLALQVGGGEEGLGDQEKDAHGKAKVMGTPLYMSPEQARALPVDGRSDQYSLGATLFHMLTGHPPYTGDAARTIMKKHVFDPVPDPADVLEGVNESWRALCMRLMAKKPEERFPTATALRDAVRHAIEGRSPGNSRRTRSTAGRPRSRLAGTAIRLGLAGLLVGGAAYAAFAIDWKGRRGEPQDGDHAVPGGQTPVIDAAEQRRQAALKALRQTLAGLPGAPLPRLEALARLRADPAYADPEAQRLVSAAITEAETARRSGERAGTEEALAKVRATIAAGRLGEARSQLETLGVPEDADLAKRVQDARRELQQALDRLSADLLAQVRAAKDAAALDQLTASISAAPLAETQARQLNEAIEARRAAIASETAAASERNDAAAFRKLAIAIQALRGQAQYIKAQGLVESLGSGIGSEAGRAECQALTEAFRGCVRSEAELRRSVKERKPKVSVRLPDGKDLTFPLADIGATDFQISTGLGSKTYPRAADSLPLRQLLDVALAGQDDLARSRAAYLWFWRAPDADEALAALGDDVLAKALRRVDEKGRLLSLPGSFRREGEASIATFDFTRKDAGELLGAFSGGLAMADGAAQWLLPPGTQKPPVDGEMPEIRCKASALPPCSATWTYRLEQNSFLGAGLDCGGRRIRLYLAPDRSTAAGGKLLAIWTADDGRSLQRVPASTGAVIKLGVTADFRHSVCVAVSAEGAVSLSFDGKPLSVANLPGVAADRPCVPFLQVPSTNSPITSLIERLELRGSQLQE